MLHFGRMFFPEAKRRLSPRPAFRFPITEVDLRKTIVLLTLLTLLAAACGPTPAPGSPTQAPSGQQATTPSPRPFVLPERPTLSPSPAGPTPTLRPTAAQPTPSVWTMADMPAERVCLIAERRGVEDDYTMAMVRMLALVARLEGNPTWMGDADYEREAKAISREIGNLPELPCTEWGKQVLMDGASDLLDAFDWYDEQPEWSAIALVNARASHTHGSQWWVGSRWWSTLSVPLH